ncbi:hypothetical protein OTU49_012539, partial [Cherax quadricarinatus]
MSDLELAELAFQTGDWTFHFDCDPEFDCTGSQSQDNMIKEEEEVAEKEEKNGRPGRDVQEPEDVLRLTQKRSLVDTLDLEKDWKKRRLCDKQEVVFQFSSFQKLDETYVDWKQKRRRKKKQRGAEPRHEPREAVRINTEETPALRGSVESCSSRELQDVVYEWRPEPPQEPYHEPRPQPRTESRTVSPCHRDYVSRYNRQDRQTDYNSRYNRQERQTDYDSCYNRQDRQTDYNSRYNRQDRQTDYNSRYNRQDRQTGYNSRYKRQDRQTDYNSRYNRQDRQTYYNSRYNRQDRHTDYDSRYNRQDRHT